jgi:clan AA aspartic protease
MIVGIVTAGVEAVITVTVEDSHGQRHAIDAVIDTGFTGCLTLPTALVKSLGLQFSGSASAILADGSRQIFDYYAAVVDWDGNVRGIEVDAVDSTPLVGMSLLRGYDLLIEVSPGGRVTIDASIQGKPP